MPSTMKGGVLLTGATGFVGSHVHDDLVEAGFDVLCGSRNPDTASKRRPTWRFCHLDLMDRATVSRALDEVTSAIYLVHTIAESDRYAELEERAARTFIAAADARGLERIVYVGGMRPRGKPSRHLASRLRTGEILRSGETKAVEIQATMIIGAGSESFRIVRDLAARLPLMVLPRWLKNLSEPVSVQDVANAVVHALKMPLARSQLFTAPGPERLSARDIIIRTARAMGQRPRVVGVPVVTPRLSSYWIRLVTRANGSVASELVEGLRHDIISDGPEIWSEMTGYERMPFDEAVREALEEEAGTIPQGARRVEELVHRIAHHA